MHIVVLCIVFLVYQSTQQFCNKRVRTMVLAFVYCLEVLLCVSTLLSHHWAIIILMLPLIGLFTNMHPNFNLVCVIISLLNLICKYILFHLKLRFQ
jgi:uncharacterized membrane protein